MTEVQGAKYQLKPGQLFRGQTAKFDNEENDRLTEEGRKFFCSELVIKAYKVCGILSPDLADEASSNWLPGDLSSAKDKIKLV